MIPMKTRSATSLHRPRTMAKQQASQYLEIGFATTKRLASMSWLRSTPALDSQRPVLLRCLKTGPMNSFEFRNRPIKDYQAYISTFIRIFFLQLRFDCSKGLWICVPRSVGGLWHSIAGHVQFTSGDFNQIISASTILPVCSGCVPEH
jgi:hypothetical protein